MLAANELENHLLVCEFKSTTGAAGGATDVDCTFHYCGCKWRGADKEALNGHLKEDLNQHLEVRI